MAWQRSAIQHSGAERRRDSYRTAERAERVLVVVEEESYLWWFKSRVLCSLAGTLANLQLLSRAKSAGLQQGRLGPAWAGWEQAEKAGASALRPPIPRFVESSRGRTCLVKTTSNSNSQSVDLWALSNKHIFKKTRNNFLSGKNLKKADVQNLCQWATLDSSFSVFQKPTLWGVKNLKKPSIDAVEFLFT